MSATTTKMMTGTQRAKQAAAPALRSLAPHLRPVEDVLDMIRDKRVVLFGEASHRTQEFYQLRCDCSKRLIEESGFRGVCLEADWPEATALHRFVMGSSTAKDVDEALEPFKSRFPVWMWRNQPVREFVAWLRERNARVPLEHRAGIFGLDLYSLDRSMQAVITYLSRRDPDAAEAVKSLYSCFDHFAASPQTYGTLVARKLHRGCRAAAAQARRRVAEHVQRSASPRTRVDDADEAFFAEVNARVVEDSERYYRAMFDHTDSSWNVRDRHFDDTLFRVRSHLAATRGGQESADRVVVWAHNSHLGDAGATQRSFVGETNLGQLARQQGGAAVVNVAQLTYDGTVTAADEWGEAFRTHTVVPGRPGSHEAALHELAVEEGRPTFAIDLRSPEVRKALAEAHATTKLERAIGVIYRPKTELQSHYFEANLPAQFDVAVLIDRTSALQALDAPEDSVPRPGTPDLMESEEEEEGLEG